jgi:hypothetical protein
MERVRARWGEVEGRREGYTHRERGVGGKVCEMEKKGQGKRGRRSRSYDYG